MTPRVFIIAILLALTAGCILDPPEADDPTTAPDGDDENQVIVDAGETTSEPETSRNGRLDGGTAAPVDSGPPVDTGQDENGRPHGAEPSEDAGSASEDFDAALNNGRDSG